MTRPLRGEIWYAELGKGEGHEQEGPRPCLVLSDDKFNAGKAELVVVLPITKRDKHVPLQIPVQPPEGGLKIPSFIMCEAIRSISVKRLRGKWGEVTDRTLRDVEMRLRTLLGF